MFDLQLKTSPTEASMVSSKTYDDVTSEFALGQVAFYPNGVWAYSQIKGNDVADEDLGMLPYYMGIKGEEDCGPVGVYDASWAVKQERLRKGQEGHARLHQVDGHRQRGQEDPVQGHGILRAIHHVHR